MLVLLVVLNADVDTVGTIESSARASSIPRFVQIASMVGADIICLVKRARARACLCVCVCSLSLRFRQAR